MLLNVGLESRSHLLEPGRVPPCKGAEPLLRVHEVLDGLDWPLVLQLHAVTDGLGRVVAEDRPDTRLDGELLLPLLVGETALDHVRDARAVGEDNCGAVKVFCLPEDLEGLITVVAEGDLRYVDVAVCAHEHDAHLLVLDVDAGVRVLHDAADRCGLRLLATRVTEAVVDENEHTHAIARGDDVVEASKVNVVGPAVTAHKPMGGLDKVVVVEEDVLRNIQIDAGLLELGSKIVHSRNDVLRVVLVVALVEPFDADRAAELTRRADGGLAVVERVEPALDGSLQGLVSDLLDVGLKVLAKVCTLGIAIKSDTPAENRVVLKERRAGGNTAGVAVEVERTHVAEMHPDKRAPDADGGDHRISVEGRQHLHRVALTAAGAGARELHVREAELQVAEVAALRVDVCGALGELKRIVGPVEELLLFVEDSVDGGHGKGILGTGLYTDPASPAVERRNLDTELDLRGIAVNGSELALHVKHLEVLGDVVRLCVLIHDEAADGGVRALDRAETALDAVLLFPHRNLGGRAELLILGIAARNLPRVVLHHVLGADVGELPRDGRQDDVLDILVRLRTVGLVRSRLARVSVDPARLIVLYVALLYNGASNVNGLHVRLDDLCLLLSVGDPRGGLHVLAGDIEVKKLAEPELEEEEDHDRVYASAKADRLRDLICIDGIDSDVLAGNLPLHLGRQILLESLDRIMLRVQDKEPVLLDAVEDVELAHVALRVAGNIPGLLDVVLGPDLLWPEAKVRDGGAAGLLAVELEVGLAFAPHAVGEDLHGVATGTNGAV